MVQSRGSIARFSNPSHALKPRRPRSQEPVAPNANPTGSSAQNQERKGPDARRTLPSAQSPERRGPSARPTLPSAHGSLEQRGPGASPRRAFARKSMPSPQACQAGLFRPLLFLRPAKRVRPIRRGSCALDRISELEDHIHSQLELILAGSVIVRATIESTIEPDFGTQQNSASHPVSPHQSFLRGHWVGSTI